jgi:hypothetical protein
MSDSAFLKIPDQQWFVTDLLTSSMNNLNTKIFIQHLYYGEQLVNISFAMPLHDVKYGLHAD